MNKAVSGGFREQRLLASLRRDMMAKAAEQQLKLESQRDIATLSADELSDEEIWILIGRRLPDRLHEAIELLFRDDALSRQASEPQGPSDKELFDKWKSKRAAGNQ